MCPDVSGLCDEVAVMYWEDRFNIVHGVLRPDDLDLPRSITYCWLSTDVIPTHVTHWYMTCLWCVTYEERAKAWDP